MCEAISAIHGALVALSFVATMCAWYLAFKAQKAAVDSQKSSDAGVTLMKEAAQGIAAAHNELVKTQAEQGATLERLQAEIASRVLRR